MRRRPVTGSAGRIDRDRSRGRHHASPSRGSWATVLAVASLFAAFAIPGAAWGQQPSKLKVPILSKIEGGSTRQAFTGKVESLDTKRKLLSVNPVEGIGTEIFPIRKSVQVESANGNKLELSELKSGRDVIIYYEQKGSRRTVKEIVVLDSGAGKTEKKAEPPS